MMGGMDVGCYILINCSDSSSGYNYEQQLEEADYW